MLADFRSVMMNKNKNNTHIPKELIDVFNKDLPKGLKYVEYMNGICHLTSEEEQQLELSLLVTIPEGAKKYEGVIKTNADLAEYAYRTQQELNLNPNKDNTVIINGNKINVKDIIKAPFMDNGRQLTGFKMVPSEFPLIPSIKLQSGGVYLTFDAKREPYDSMTEIFIRFKYKDFIIIDMIMNEKTQDSKLTISMEVETSTAAEMLKVYKFYNGFIDGNVKYKGEPIGIKSNAAIEKVDLDTIRLLNKIVKLEKKLGVTLIIPQIIKSEDVKTAEQLYSCLILGKPFKTYANFGEITGTGKFYKSLDRICNKTISFTCVNEKTVRLLGIDINIYDLQGLFNIFVEKAEIEKNKEFKIKTKPSPVGKSYMSEMYFLTEEAMCDFQGHDDWLNQLKNAKKIKVT